MRWIGFVIAVLSLLLAAFAPMPVAASGDFERGLTLYEAEAFEQAAGAFEAAVAGEPDSADSNFYLGLALYKLNRYTAAGAAFERAAEIDPAYGAALLFRGLSHQADGAYDRAVPFFRKAAEADPDFEQLAYYNIGISLYRAGDPDAAKEALDRAIALDPDSESAGDARQLLASIEAIGEGYARDWRASVSAGYQYDDNVSTDEIDVVTNVHDTAFVFDASASYKMLRGSVVDLEIGYDFFQSLYDDQDDSDLQLHSASLVAEKRLGALDASLSYVYARALLGRNDFLGLHSLTPSLGYGVTPAWYVNLLLNFQDKNFIDNRDRNSRVHGAGLNNFLSFMDGRGSFSAGYRIETEDTKGPEFEYLGHFLHAALAVPVPGPALARWNPKVTLGWAYFNKNYENVTAIIADERKDERITLSLGLTADLTERVQAKFRYERIEATSNLADADFDQNIATLLLGLTF